MDVAETPALTLMERQRQGAVEELVEAAVELFNRDGFEGTTVEAIAASAGCSSRTFYRYFGDKEAVMFHDLPAAFERLRGVIDGHLEKGLEPWSAVTESVLDMIGRFDDERTPIQRMVLWQREPALRARYLFHVDAAERTIVDCLCRHRRTTPDKDDVAQAMAIAAIGAYRATVATHTAKATGNGRLAEHLRELLATLGKLGGAPRPG